MEKGGLDLKVPHKIIIGKFGKSINFEPLQWGMIGGDSESAIFAQSIAHLYPDDTFYLVSRNNFSKLPIDTQMKINKNNNLVDCWKNYDKSINNQDWLINYFKNIKIDFGLLYSGLSGSSTIENYMHLKNGEYAKPLSSSKNYTGIITKFLNESQIPYMEIGEDSRFFPLVARDLYNRSKRILGEKEDVKSCKHITSQSNQELITTDIKVSNVDHSCMFLMSEDKSKLLKNPNDRKSKLNLFMHCTASHNKYYPETFSIIKDYVLDQFPDTMIYGKWEKELPNVKEIPMIDLHDVLYDTKYTLTIGGSNNYPTASKFWKMLIFGIIPFCYKEIDIEKFNIPEFLYVKNPEDLKNKIDYLENNIDFYNNLWYDLQNIILNDDLWNGNTFFGNIEKWIKAEFGYDIERKGTITHRTSSLFVKEKTNTLEEFFS
tara:strand:+ start:2905 stop:4197 length:1293 start_codon:yes stop_codon:yes gene_type:complete